VDADLTGATWRKSTYSNGNGGNCVEATAAPGDHLALRDSKNPTGPALLFSTRRWRTFIQGIKLSNTGN
jgi:hypothetical protein